MRPISGTGSVLSAPNMRDAAAASRMFSSSENSTVFAIQLMSAPAQNDLPAPRNTTARTSGSPWIVDAHAGKLGDQLFVERVAHVRSVQRDVTRPDPRGERSDG